MPREASPAGGKLDCAYGVERHTLRELMDLL